MSDNNTATPANNADMATIVWRLYFEMAEGHRYKQAIGEVPQAALAWLEDHWELLPRNGEMVTGELQGTPSGVWWYETTEKTRSDGDRVEVVATTVHAPERVEL